MKKTILLLSSLSIMVQLFSCTPESLIESGATPQACCDQETVIPPPPPPPPTDDFNG